MIIRETVKVSDKTKRKENELNYKVKYAMTIKAWGLFIQGKKATKKQLEWEPGQAFPKIYDQKGHIFTYARLKKYYKQAPTSKF